jgi:carboxyl-terminal processing protease
MYKKIRTHIMQKLINRLLPLCLAALPILSACSKKNDVIALNAGGSGGGAGSGTTPSQMKDSVLLLTRDVYLWNTQLPTSFDVQSYGDPASIMTAIRPYSLEPGFSGAVDRWSFAMKKTEWDQLSGGMGTTFSTTTNGDLGFSVFFRAEGDLRVSLVEPNAPAGLAGIHRGWRITAINGNTNITTANSDFIVNAVYYSAGNSFTFKKPDGSVVSITLTAGHYTQKAVYLDTVYHAGGKTIGYLVFNSFLGNTAQINSEFQRVFTRFTNAQVTDVVVDLRYNGGGYVSLAAQLSNYLVRSSASGTLMMKQLYNSNNSANNTTTNFNKAGSLNLDDVYFIVGRGTASASELVINNLKPQMDVKLIGATPTHGKPVGFFAIPVADWYIFPVSFKTVNKNGEGNYYNGFPVNGQVADGLDKDWGDVSEASLASAINNITTGSYFGRSAQEQTYKEDAAVSNGNDILNKPGLKITIDKAP